MNLPIFKESNNKYNNMPMYYNYTPQDFLLFLKIFQLPSQYFHAFKVGRPAIVSLVLKYTKIVSAFVNLS